MQDTRRQISPKIPRGEVRRRELLAEAARVLLRDGLDGCSMDLIAAEAGASKATLYRHFGDRHGLVVEAVQYLCAEFIADVDREPPVKSDLRAGLTAILQHLVNVLSKPDHPAFFRLIVLGSQRDPAIGRTWLEHGPLVWHAMLRRVFEVQRAKGGIPADADYTHCPEMLFDAVFADMIVRTAVLGEEREARQSDPRYLQRLVDSVVANIEKPKSQCPGDESISGEHRFTGA